MDSRLQLPVPIVNACIECLFIDYHSVERVHARCETSTIRGLLFFIHHCIRFLAESGKSSEGSLVFADHDSQYQQRHCPSENSLVSSATVALPLVQLHYRCYETMVSPSLLSITPSGSIPAVESAKPEMFTPALISWLPS